MKQTTHDKRILKRGDRGFAEGKPVLVTLNRGSL